MALPVEEKPGVPGWVVTMSDMMTLLLTFFVLLVAMADTRSGALAGVGQGAFVKRVLQGGKPGIMPGAESLNHKKFELDRWWIPTQKGDPDQLEKVYEKLLREIMPRFKPDELSVTYQHHGLGITLGSRIDFDESGRPRPGPEVRALLRQIADQLRRDPSLELRIEGHAPRGESWNTDLYASAHQGALVFAWLQRLGVEPQRMSLWGWGSSRLLVRSDPSSPANRAISLQLIAQTGEEAASE